MATNIWQGSTTAVAQVDTFTPANVAVGDVFTLTLTDDNGDTKAISFTATAATVANVTAGLVAAWNASTDSRIARITAADATTALTLTADTAGRPFSVASTTTDGDASDTQTLTRAATTANSGPNDYGVVSNWSLGAIPTTADDVVIPAGAPAILYGLNQSSVAIGDFWVQPGFTNNIGRIDNGVHYLLRIDPNSQLFNGTSVLAMIDVGAWAGTINVKSSGTASTGLRSVYIKGSALATVNVNGGNVGIGMNPGDTTTSATTVNVTGSASCEIGSGVTLATLNDSTNSTSSSVTVNCAATTITQNATQGTLRTQGSGAVTTITVRGTAYLNSSGTVTTVENNGTVDFSESNTARTVTTFNVYEGSVTKDPSEAVTFTNDLILKQCGVEDVTLQVGKDITLTRT